MTVYGVIQFSYRMRLLPDELQGSVNSVYRRLLFAGDPLGLALTGALLQVSGVAATVWICSACLAVLALLTMLNRSLRAARDAPAFALRHGAGL
jgi:uncharacterized membrane protein